MKRLLVLSAIVALKFCSGAQTNPVVELKTTIASFTNLQGKVYSGIQLVRADQTGILYRVTNGAGGGFIYYSNVTLATLEDWKVPTNMVTVANQYAEKKRLDRIAAEKARADLEAKQEAERVKNAYKMGFNTGRSRGTSDGMAIAFGSTSVQKPTAEQLEFMAGFAVSGMYSSELTGELHKSNAPRPSKEFQEKFVEGYKAGYRQAFGNSTKPAF